MNRGSIEGFWGSETILYGNLVTDTRHYTSLQTYRAQRTLL